MIKKILTLYGLILILMLLIQNTTKNSPFPLQLKAQDYSSENNPPTSYPCPFCYCNFSASGDCCCSAVTVYAPLPCLCNACLCSYICENGHSCTNVDNSASGDTSGGTTGTGGGGGGGGSYTPPPTWTEQDFLDYINNFWSAFNPPIPDPVTPIYKLTTPTATMQSATRIINNSRVTLATDHESGVTDNANANQNLIDASKGLLATRSNYENAPGGKIDLNNQMLGGIKMLADMGNSFKISEIAGVSHAVTSTHYQGIAIDVSWVNGVRVIYMDSVKVCAFDSAAQAAGAVKILRPYRDAGHNNHFHIEW